MIQLKPYGTVTARWAGAGDKMNFQNMPRDNQIRDCLVAPPGYLIVDVDLSQIEYRVLCAIASQTNKLEALRQGRDVYSELASKLYGFPVSKLEAELFVFPGSRHDDQCDSISQALLDKNNSFMAWLSPEDWEVLLAKSRIPVPRPPFGRHGGW